MIPCVKICVISIYYVYVVRCMETREPYVVIHIYARTHTNRYFKNCKHCLR